MREKKESRKAAVDQRLLEAAFADTPEQSMIHFSGAKAA